jgi:hypothetical protein
MLLLTLAKKEPYTFGNTLLTSAPQPAHRVRRRQHGGALQSRDSPEHGRLVLRLKGAGEAVGVHHVAVKALGLEPHLGMET